MFANFPEREKIMLKLKLRGNYRASLYVAVVSMALGLVGFYVPLPPHYRGSVFYVAAVLALIAIILGVPAKCFGEKEDNGAG